MLRCSCSPASSGYSSVFGCYGSEAKNYQSQRLVSWRGNLLCFRSSRGEIISFIGRFPRWTDFAACFLVLKFSSSSLGKMSAMKDITNFSSNTAENSHDSSPERDIFVSFVAPSSRKRSARQASMEKFLQKSEALGNASDEDDVSESEGDGEANSVFMTPETPTESRPKVNRTKRKKLRLAGSPRNETSSPALSVTLNGLTKAQLVDLVNTLVAERHPDLEQVVCHSKYVKNKG